MKAKKIDVTPEMLEKSLRCCAEENPAPAGHEPCEDCYLWQLHLVKGGRVSTGETCSQHLNEEAIACIRQLSNKLEDLEAGLRIARGHRGQIKKSYDEKRIENEQLRAVIIQMDPDFFKRKCRVCGCDWNHPCNDHDFWVEDDHCSACAEKKHEGVI